jgi:hypothetical protein
MTSCSMCWNRQIQGEGGGFCVLHVSFVREEQLMFCVLELYVTVLLTQDKEVVISIVVNIYWCSYHHVPCRWYWRLVLHIIPCTLLYNITSIYK